MPGRSLLRQNVSFIAAFLGLLVAGTCAMPALVAQDKDLCRMPQKSSYSPGAVAEHEGQVYQCLFVYGEDLAPAGVAWIKVERSKEFVPGGRGGL